MYPVTFKVPEWGLSSISSVPLRIACDNHFAVTFNGVEIAPKWSGGLDAITTYELKPWVVGFNATSIGEENRLEILALNTGGPGGLVFLLEIVY